jgi:predicted ATPase
VKPLATVQVPGTVQAILAARIDRLPPEEKRLLQAAAVIGEDVAFPLLAAITEEPEETLQRGLAHLQASEFLYEARLFPELEYTFKHALTYQVAYNSLLQERRRALHARIVDTFERLHTDRLAEHVERLAHHALHGEVWEKAVGYLRQAGLRAMGRAANREAVTYLEQALEALGHIPEQRDITELAIDLRFDLRTALVPLADWERMQEHLRSAEVLATGLGDRRRLARVSIYMVIQSVLAQEYEEAVRFGQQALSIGQVLADLAIEVPAKAYLGSRTKPAAIIWRRSTPSSGTSPSSPRSFATSDSGRRPAWPPSPGRSCLSRFPTWAALRRRASKPKSRRESRRRPACGTAWPSRGMRSAWPTWAGATSRAGGSCSSGASICAAPMGYR